MIMPFGFTSFKEALRSVCEIYAILKKELANSGHSTALGDEGGFAPNLANNRTYRPFNDLYQKSRL